MSFVWWCVFRWWVGWFRFVEFYNLGVVGFSSSRRFVCAGSFPCPGADSRWHSLVAVFFPLFPSPSPSGCFVPSCARSCPCVFVWLSRFVCSGPFGCGSAARWLGARVREAFFSPGVAFLVLRLAGFLSPFLLFPGSALAFVSGCGAWLVAAAARYRLFVVGVPFVFLRPVWLAGRIRGPAGLVVSWGCFRCVPAFFGLLRPLASVF